MTLTRRVFLILFTPLLVRKPGERARAPRYGTGYVAGGYR
jgi:hypothetical protein